MKSILRINLSEKNYNYEEVKGEISKWAGRGLTSYLVYKEIPPSCIPTGPSNKLIFSPGYLAGTICSSSGRLSIGGKSPLTGTIKEANVGGTAGRFIARLGLRGIVLEGSSDDWSILVLGKDKVEFIPADDYKGLGNYELVGKLGEKYGKSSIISIGIAGEMLLPASSIAVTDVDGRPARHAGRGGLGAVMGSKKVKALVILDEGGDVDYVDKEGFVEKAREFAKLLTENEVTGKLLRELGTNVLMKIINDAGALPTKNFRSGRFEKVDNISGETMAGIIKERGGDPSHACMLGCVIRCSNVYVDKEGKYVTSGLEYETLWANGANLLIDDLDILAEMDRTCDDLGLDTIETGDTLAVLMEAGYLEWGDGKKALEVLKEVYKNSLIGRIIGSGCVTCARIFGVNRVPQVKGQGLPAYDPRACKGIGVTYATSPMGADHTAGYAVAPSILKVGGDADPLAKEGQVELSRDLQFITAFFDCTGLCIFTTFAIFSKEGAMGLVYDMIDKRLGLRFDDEKAMEMGKEIIKMEVDFNKRAGFSEFSNDLPEFFKKEAFPPHGTIFDVEGDKIKGIFT